jgi:hypothetical protein
VRKLFEKEEDNNFEEEVGILQLCAYHLRNLILKRQSLTSDKQQLTDWMKSRASEVGERLGKLLLWVSSYEVLLLLEVTYVVQPASASWSPYITYKASIFLEVYRQMLSLLCLPLAGDGSENGAFTGKRPSCTVLNISDLIASHSLNMLHPSLSTPLRAFCNSMASAWDTTELFFVKLKVGEQ